MDIKSGSLLLMACLACGSLSAAETGGVGSHPAIQLQGFGTLGVARSDDGNAQFVRDLSQPGGLSQGWSSKIDTLLGLQANISFDDHNEGVIQAVSRYHQDGSYTPELTWAFLRHEISPDSNLRLGRLGTEFFMLGDTRLVGYSNLTLRPPPDYFGSLVFTYIDGMDASITQPFAGGLACGKFYGGLSPEKTSFGNGATWDLRGSQLLGGYVDYLKGPWQVRLSHAQVRFKKEIPIDDWLTAAGNGWATPYLSNVPGMEMAGTKAHFSSLGLVYDEGPLQLQLMLNRIDQDSPAYEDSKAGYAIAAYKFGSVTPYLGFSRVVSSMPPLPAPEASLPPALAGMLTILTEGMTTFSHSDQHTVFLGARWDLRQNIALKAQVDWIHGKPTSVFTFRNQNMSAWDGSMTVVSVALDFVF
jgi:hypothetical protein